MDNLTKAQRSKNMRNIRSQGTTPERVIMSELLRRRIRFETHSKELPGKPDIVFPRKRLVVFIDSDFWHYNTRRCTMPATNRRYWKQKLESNRNRDRQIRRRLRSLGWRVLRLWELDIKHSPESAVMKVVTELRDVRE